MEDADFDDLLDQYLEGTLAPNLEMADVEMVWVEGNPNLGALHIAAHGVTKDEVEEVLLEVPPEVEAKRHRDHPGRTLDFIRNKVLRPYNSYAYRYRSLKLPGKQLITPNSDSVLPNRNLIPNKV